MRVIKFRGKTSTLPANEAHQQIDGRWFCGYLVSDNRGNVRPETIGQFTGLLDKNGKEIYEGDILQMRLEDTVEPSGGFFHKMYVRFTKEKGYVLWGKNMTIEDAEPLFKMLEWFRCENCTIIGADGNIIGTPYEGFEL